MEKIGEGKKTGTNLRDRIKAHTKSILLKVFSFGMYMFRWFSTPVLWLYRQNLLTGIKLSQTFKYVLYIFR